MLSTKQGIQSIVVGVSISLFNALTQFLTIYFILQRYGTEFNGFIRLISSLSSIFATADGTLGIATVLLLINPMMKGDWISANEIYSTAKKNYKKGAWVSLILISAIAVLYPLFVSVGGLNGLFDASEWQNVGLNINGTSPDAFVQYWKLILITVACGFKNFTTAFFFGVYENLIAADNRNVIRRIAILFTDTFIYGIFLGLLMIENIDPILPFLIVLCYSPVKGFLCFLYAKRKYPWLKYHRDINNFRLNVVSKKLRAPTLGISLLQNTDIIIVSIFFGLNVSSDLSLYLVIAVNVRIIMSNFIISFREYFTTLIAKNGRIYWKSYTKYELYTYIIAGFTFVNMLILAPYFVNALYGNLARESINAMVATKINTKVSLINSLNFIFSNFWFSGIFAFSTSLSLLCESQMTLIQAKGQAEGVAKFQNYLGACYIVFAIISAIIFGVLKVGGTHAYVYGIAVFYALKSVFQLIRYGFLWVFVWKYVTYNSDASYVARNFLTLLSTIVIGVLFAALLFDKQYDINLYAGSPTATMAPLVAIFFATVFSSLLIIFVIALIIEPRLFAGIFKNLPIINELIGRKRRSERKKRLADNKIDVESVVNKQELVRNIALDGYDTIDVTNVFEEMTNTDDEEPVYVIKG
jgi:hypothetical protein